MARSDMIKRPNVVSEYTPEQILEMKKCAEDPVYFAKNYVKVQHPKLGSIPFVPYEYQERCLNAFRNNRWAIVLAGRQLGKCVHKNTKISIAKLPKGFKKILLKIFFRNEYDKLFEHYCEKIENV